MWHTIKDEFVSSTERVGDLDKARASLRWEGLSGSPAATRKEQEISSASLTNGVHGLLDGVDPGRDRWDVMRLVHDTEDDAFLVAVLLS